MRSARLRAAHASLETSGFVPSHQPNRPPHRCFGTLKRSPAVKNIPFRAPPCVTLLFDWSFPSTFAGSRCVLKRCCETRNIGFEATCLPVKPPSDTALRKRTVLRALTVTRCATRELLARLVCVCVCWRLCQNWRYTKTISLRSR